MDASDVPVFEVNPNPPPRPFAVASWLGMKPEEITAGLADGTIVPPPGARPDWRPPGMIAASDRAPLLSQTPASSVPLDQGAGAPDRAQVQGWFQALDSTLTDSAFDAIWNRAGEDDPARAAGLTKYLARTLLGTAPTPTAGGDNAAATMQFSRALSTFTADPSHRAHIVDLAGMDGATLSRMAQTEVGYRYALSHLDSVALTGNRSLFATANGDSALDRFDPDTGQSQLSDAWLADRGKFLAWKMAGDAGHELTIDGAQSWSFTDFTKTDAGGAPLTLKLTAAQSAGVENQVIFGSEAAESIKGKAGTDRIYGGGGDDLLRGGAGADHLEGGHGDDAVMGGSGNDELTGNQGIDDLDGGRGNDSLDGGSGDDMLTGGRGDDQLAGGAGADTYVIDAGDGSDTIIDADGLGTIALDDEVIAGAVQDQNGTWTSANGRIEYSVDGDLAGENTLTVRAFAADADHGGTPDNVVQVQHWHNGDLGITLGANGAAGQPVGTQVPGTPDTGPQAIADTFPDNVVNPQDSGGDAASATSESNSGPSTTMDPTSAGLGQAPASDASNISVVSTDESFDVDHALQQLLGSGSDRMTVVEPTRVHHAIAAFSRVPTPPDVSFATAMGGDAGNNAVSIGDVAHALAGDAGGHDFGHEFASGLVPMVPDWHRGEATAASFDGVPRGVGVGTVGAWR